MPEKLPVVSGKATIKILVKMGFEVRMGRGDHVVLKKDNKVFVVPLHGMLKKGTLRKILKEAEVTIEEFNRLL